MGLDITAYRKLTEDQNPTLNECGEVDYQTHWVCNSLAETERHWPGRTEGLRDGVVYSFADKFSMHAGSYTGYSQWRNWLAEMAGYGSANVVWNTECVTGPFVELIDFSYCEGIIGPVVAAKLAKDFADLEAQIAAKCSDDNHYFLSKYREWRNAFEMAADGGAVAFH